MSHNPYLKYVEKHVHGLQRSEMQVLVKLCVFMKGNKTHRCIDASIDTMADWFFISRSTVKRSVRSLERMGIIHRVMRRGQTNKIIFGEVFWNGFTDHADLDFSANKGGVMANQGGVMMSQKGGHDEPQSERQDITRSSSNYNRGSRRPFGNPYKTHKARLRLVVSLKAQDTFPSGGVL